MLKGFFLISEVQVPTNMFSYKTGVILLVNYPVVYENISPGTCIISQPLAGSWMLSTLSGEPCNYL